MYPPKPEMGDFFALKKELQQDKVRPLYLLWGNDRFLLKEAESLILKKILPENERTSSLRVFEEGFEIKDLLTEIKTLPFLSRRKVVILREGKRVLEEFSEELLKFSKQPTPGVFLIIWTQQEVPEALKELAFSLNFTYRDSLNFLLQRAKENGLILSREALTFLREVCGNELEAICQEIEKIALYKGPGFVTLKDLEGLVFEFKTKTVFELIETIEKGNLKKALEILKDLFEQGEASPKILGAMAWKIREVLKRQREEKLLKLWKDLYKLDFQLKRSGRASRFLFEDFILELSGKVPA
jgi:DNA polymerase-3 subunit delta